MSTDLELDWSTDIDLSISTQGPDSSGFVSFSLDNLSVASHVLTVTATDTTGLIGQAQVSIKVVQNSLPTIGSVTLSPDPVYVGDSLTCSYAGFTDADGHADSSTFQWKIDGTSSGSTNTLNGGFAKDEKVKCVVTPNDGIEDGTSVNASITVSNTLPIIGAVSISPANPLLDDTLTCNYTGFDDADGDSDSSSIEWFVGGTAAGTSSTLSGAFVGGDQVSCTVTANDGEADGMALSGTTIIENTAPSVASVTLSPNPTMSTDLLTCSYSGYSDPDGDGDVSRYEWSVNGSVVSKGSTTLQSVFGRGDEVECAVIPSDGIDDGTPVSSSIVITNQAPEATVFLSPTAVATDATVNAVTTTNDVDGDSVTLSYNLVCERNPCG